MSHSSEQGARAEQGAHGPPGAYGELAAQLAGVRALVSGATSGLGSAMADALARAGATVAAAARPTPRLEQWVEQRHGEGLAVVAAPMDVRLAESVHTALHRLIGSWGGVDMLVNNAGAGIRVANEEFLRRPQPFWEVTPEAFAEVVTTNLTGYFLLRPHAVAPVLVAQGHGRIVNVTTSYATMRRRGFVPYGPSRAGSEALSLVMGEDLAPFGVAVNQLLPGGATRSGMTEGLPTSSSVELLDPEIMGPPAVFLASPEAEGLSGERIIAREFPTWLAELRASRQAGVSPTRG